MTAPEASSSRTAGTTIAVAGGLLALKVAAWLVTGSAGVLGSALDSFLDLLASLLVLWAVVEASRPPDAAHPWGHGKAEGLASLFQGLIILLAAAGLLFEGWRRFKSGEPVVMPGVGIAVMAISIGVTIWWVYRLRAAAAATGSPALAADSAHYASDVALNGSVVVGLVLTELFASRWPDLIVSAGIAVWVGRTAIEVVRHGIDNLMDSGLKPEEAAVILEVVQRFYPGVAGFHDLRTRRSGADVFIEIHLDVDRSLSFPDAHDLGDRVRNALESEIARSRVTIHADPV